MYVSYTALVSEENALDRDPPSPLLGLGRCSAASNSMLTSEPVYEMCKAEMEFKKLDPIKVKGKSAMIPIFLPIRPERVQKVGVCDEKIVFPSNRAPQPSDHVFTFLKNSFMSFQNVFMIYK